MITSIDIKNLGPIKELAFEPQKINVIIGENSSGKTLILKMLYTTVKTLEEHKRGDDNRTIKEILSNKIRWTFQVDKIGDLVTKSQSEKLSIAINVKDTESVSGFTNINTNFSYSFSSSADKQINDVSDVENNKESNSIFLPAKEVLSLFKIIMSSREIDKVFGFDDTYYDLVKALTKDTQMGNNFAGFKDARLNLEKIIDGSVTYRDSKWSYKKGDITYSIHSTAEGIKKIAILDRLIGNKYLSPNSIIFIDEPESVLHPKAIIEFLNILQLLSNRGVQIFIATHSYFVIKKLMLIAKEHNIEIPIISIKNTADSNIEISNLKDGMPDNEIINTSIALYEEEVEMVLGK